jgi:hypothetical protein
MNPHEAEPPGQDWQIEISDMRAGAPTTLDAGGALPGKARSPRERAIRLGLTATGLLLAIALMLAGIPEVRDGARRVVAGLGPQPTPTLQMGEGVFYFEPNPPGTVILVDGKVLAVPPLVGSVHPLVLVRGRHQLAWRAHGFPFTPITCTLTVPAAVRDSCEFVPSELIAEERLTAQGHVLAARLSHDTLPPDTLRQLDTAIQLAIGGVSATGEMAPGDHYFYCPQGQQCHIATALVPMHAQLTYQLIADRSYPEPCVLGEGVPCRFAGQDCGQLCTVAVTPSAIAGSGADAARVWTAAVVVQAAWRFVTQDGGVILNNVPEMFGAQLMVLRITWDGDGWHVAPVFGHTPGLDAVDDVVCDPLRVWLAQSTWGFMLLDAPPGASVRFVSTTDPASGCLAALDQAPGSAKPAYFLQHFGAPLVMNDVGYNPQDQLARANLHELAQAEPLYEQLTP